MKLSDNIDQQQNQIKRPGKRSNRYEQEQHSRGNVMPPSNLTNEQIQQLTTFLISLPKD